MKLYTYINDSCMHAPTKMYSSARLQAWTGQQPVFQTDADIQHTAHICIADKKNLQTILNYESLMTF